MGNCSSGLPQEAWEEIAKEKQMMAEERRRKEAARRKYSSSSSGGGSAVAPASNTDVTSCRVASRLPSNLSSVIPDVFPILGRMASQSASKHMRAVRESGCDFTVMDCVRNPILFDMFLAVVSGRFAEENLLFLRDLDSLRKLLTDAERRGSEFEDHRRRNIDFIVCEYLEETSPLSINISASMRRKFLDRYARVKEQWEDEQAPLLPEQNPRTPRPRRLRSQTPRTSPAVTPSSTPRVGTMVDARVKFVDIGTPSSSSSSLTSQELSQSVYSDRDVSDAITDSRLILKLFQAPEDAVCSLLESNFLSLLQERVASQLSPVNLSPKSRSKCRVVVIGGGFCGAYCARKLDRDSRVHVTLVDAKDYFEYTPSMPKTIVHPSHHRNICVPHTKYVKNGRVLVGAVRVVRENWVTVGCQDVPYDKVVIATGSHYPSGLTSTCITESFRVKQLKSGSRQLRSAKRVLIIGGGVIGVELACEIRERYPKKNITIVHHGPRLLNSLPMTRYSHDFSEAFFRKHRIKYVLNTTIETFDEINNLFIDNHGRVYEAQRAFWCGGPLPVSGFMSPEFSHVLEPSGHIMVNSQLQIEGHPSMYCGGDASNFSNYQVKTMVGRARRHGIVIANNIIRDLKGKSQSEHHDPDHHDLPSVISMGSVYGLEMRGLEVHFGEFVELKEKCENWILHELRQGKTMVPKDKRFHFDFRNML